MKVKNLILLPECNDFGFLVQRLPRKSSSEPPSICVTPYPTPTGEYARIRNDVVEKEVEVVQKIVSVVRSTRSDYNLPNKIKYVERPPLTRISLALLFHSVNSSNQIDATAITTVYYTIVVSTPLTVRYKPRIKPCPQMIELGGGVIDVAGICYH